MMLKFSPFFSDAAKPSGLGFLPFLVFATFLNSASCFSARGCSSSAMWRAAAPDSPMLLSTNSRSLARGGALRLRLRPRADLQIDGPGSGVGRADAGASRGEGCRVLFAEMLLARPKEIDGSGAQELALNS